MTRRLLLGALLMLGCDPSSHDLVVQLRTDCAPGIECSRVEARTDGRVVERVLDATASSAGLEVGRFEALATGSHEVRVDLYGPRGLNLVGSRRVLVEVRSSTVITVLMTRDCFGVTCGETQSCLGGRCVAESCLSGEEPSCPTPECSADPDCADGTGCLRGRCNSGVCFQVADDSLCTPMVEICDPTRGCVPAEELPDAGSPDAGGVDAGSPDAGAIDAGAPAVWITRVSVGLGGEPNGGSFDAHLSGDARYVAFGSDATNLVVDDTNNVRDAFLLDRDMGVTRRVSVSTAGVQGDDDALAYSIGGDPPLVAFASRATTLVAGDTNMQLDVFVHDTATASTRRYSVGRDGTTEGDNNAFSPQLSADGASLVFDTYAGNLGFATNGRGTILLRDVGTFNLEVISVAGVGPGPATDGDSDQPTISGGGRLVAFRSTARSVSTEKTLGTHDIIVRDRMTPSAQVVSRASAGGSSSLSDENARISADGRWVVFQSNSGDITAGDFNTVHDIFLYEVATREMTLISRPAAGQANGGSFNPSISNDGARVVFDSLATNLVVGDTNGKRDVFLWEGGVVTRLSVAADGTQADQNGSTPRISGDGAFVVFQSRASNLVAADTNGDDDIFLVDLSVTPP